MSDIISGLDARMVLDSRGNPTVEVDCYVDGALLGRAMVPSGASTGAYEAVELRDGDASRWLGKGVEQAVTNVVETIQEAIIGMPVDDQKSIDQIMLELDGTPNKSNLGANAMLGVSMACLHAGAAIHELPLWRYVGGVAGGLMPVPMLPILVSFFTFPIWDSMYDQSHQTYACRYPEVHLVFIVFCAFSFDMEFSRNLRPP